MIKIEEIKKIIELVFTSGRIKGARPLSLMLVAGAGSGKTEMITGFKGKNIVTATDLSYMGLIKIMEQNLKIKHIIVPDFIKLTSKKGSTSANLISFLNNFLEDGIDKIELYNMSKDFKGKRGGIVTATTKQSYYQNKKKWIASGFLSRLVLVSYEYSDKTMAEIQEFVANNFRFEKDIKTIGCGEVDIKDNPKINLKVITFSKGDIRRQKQLQTLLKCNAFLNNRKEVIEEDFKQISKLTKFINDDFVKV